MKTQVLALVPVLLIAWANLSPVEAAPTAASAQENPSFLSGKVVKEDQSALPLEQRLNAAREHFRAAKQGEWYFSAYVFPARCKVHHGSNDCGGPFQVSVEAGEIHFHGPKRGQNFETKNQAGPAGLLLLHSTAEQGSGVQALYLLDPEAGYEFKNIPVYWLGAVEADQSLLFLDKAFELGDEELQNSILFAVSQHNSPRSFDLLKRAALAASLRLEVRKAAVFWVGTIPDPRSLGLLKEVLRGSANEDLKEHAVFALTLTDSREALAEIIRVAKSDPDPEVRKKAVFWLGQKASQESVETLKGVLEKSDEELAVKEAAVFAISQLPKNEAVPMLLAIAKENKSPAIRKRAIFWLGQTGEKEALAFFEEILLKKN